jgi:general secretion pathway protein D
VKRLISLVVLSLFGTWLVAQTNTNRVSIIPQRPPRTNATQRLLPPRSGPDAATTASPTNQPAVGTTPAASAPAVTTPARVPDFPPMPGAPPAGSAAARTSVSTNVLTRPGTASPGNVLAPAGQGPATLPVPGGQVPSPLPAPGAGAVAPVRLPPGQNQPRNPVENPNPEQVYEAKTFDIRGMELPQFFELYAEISGKTVLRPYTITGGPQGITLKAQTDWTRTEAIYAMDAVLALNEVAMLHVDEKFVKAVPVTIAPQVGAELYRAGSTNLVQAENFVTKIVELKTVKPSEIAQLLASFSKSPQAITPFDNNQTIVLRDFASNVKRMMEVVEQIDVIRESNYRLEVIPIKYGKVVDFYDTMSSLISGSAGGGVSSSAGRTGANRRTARTGTGGAGQQGNQFNRTGQNLQPQQAGQTSVGAAQGTFQNRLQQIVSRAAQGPEVEILEDARIVPDERSNKLLIFASARDMAMITNMVAKLDVLQAQVLIEAIIMEVKLGDSQTLGVSMAQNPKRWGTDLIGAGGINNGPSLLGSITNFPSGLPSGFNYYGKIADTLDIAVSAIAENSTINVVSRPRIQTSHAIPGNFFIGETVPYIEGFSDYGGFVGGGGLSTRSQVQKVQIGFDLYVTPFITPDGLVFMEIQQTFDTRGRDVLIDGNPVPIINNRTADATITVRDGQTIMMGGFITENKSKSRSGVPILKDIPLLGALFRTKNDSNDRTELIVLMRAKVLETPEDAALTATVEKSQLPGIQQAEKSFEEANRKRQQQSTKRRR